MPPVGFEPTISADERLQTYALDRAATGTGDWIITARIWSVPAELCLINLPVGFWTSGAPIVTAFSHLYVFVCVRN